MANSKTLDLLEKVRLGDEQAKEKVVKDNLGLVWSIVHRFKNSYYDKKFGLTSKQKKEIDKRYDFLNEVWNLK